MNIQISNKSTDKETHKIQDRINKRLKSIARLKKQKENLHLKIEKIKSLYNETIGNQQKTLFLDYEKLIVKLFKRYKEKSFTQWQKEILLEWVLMEINDLSEHGFFTDRLSEISNEIHQESMSQMTEFEKELIKEEMKNMFTDFGMDLDEDEIDLNNLSFDDIKEKLFEESQKKQAEEKQNDQKIKIEHTPKDFHKLYKKLVKMVHPDLVKDEEEKLKSEEWMKQLSGIWEERDYLNLLILEQEITGSEEVDVNLDATLLEPFLQHLNMERLLLDDEIYEMKYENPTTAFYYQNFNASSKKKIELEVREFEKKIQQEHTSLLQSISDLKSQKSTKIVLEEKRMMSTMMDFSEQEILNDLFGV